MNKWYWWLNRRQSLALARQCLLLLEAWRVAAACTVTNGLSRPPAILQAHVAEMNLNAVFKSYTNKWEAVNSSQLPQASTSSITRAFSISIKCREAKRSHSNRLRDTLVFGLWKKRSHGFKSTTIQTQCTRLIFSVCLTDHPHEFIRTNGRECPHL